MTVKTIFKSDILGAMASGLCVVHCIATPFLFIAKECSFTACCASSPTWWRSIDYLFILITFFAVYQSARNSNHSWVKHSLFLSWILLTFLTLNETFQLTSISSWWKYLAAFTLISLHLYNLKYCTCRGETCCSEF